MSDEYLWNRKGSPDREIARLERELEQFRFDATRHRPRFSSSAPAPDLRRRWLGRAALSATAAVLVLVVATTLWVRDRSIGWEIEWIDATGERTGASQALLQAGGSIATDERSRIELNLAGFGRVSVAPDSRLALVSSTERRQRLSLERGAIHATIWAPPGRFFVETPSGSAVDLGCIYALRVDDDGSGELSVEAGWVAFESAGRESFVPAGATCRFSPEAGPGVPFFDDSRVDFREALDRLQAPGSPGRTRRASLDRLLAGARDRDALTLWHLLSRLERRELEMTFVKLAELVPPPAGVTREGVLAGRRAMLDRWWNALGHGDAEWWRQWLGPIPNGPSRSESRR